MAQGTVVVAGGLPIERLALDHLVAQFGWSFKTAYSIRDLSELSVDHNLVAVLFSPRCLGLPWKPALYAILDAAPGALPILCHGFADPIDWPQLAEAGGFHSLLMPFNFTEVRLSLGFVWDAKSRSETIPMRHDSHRRTIVLNQTQQSSARIAGVVA